jgi:hypothetical protein
MSVPLDFRSGLEAAWKAHLQEQERSMSQLLGTIMALHQRALLDDAVPVERMGLLSGTAPSNVINMNGISSALPNTPDPVLLGVVQTALTNIPVAAKSAALEDVVPNVRKDGFERFDALQDHDNEDCDNGVNVPMGSRHSTTNSRLISECNIDRLPFMTDCGDVKIRPTAFERHFGLRSSDVRDKIASRAKCVCFEPRGGLLGRFVEGGSFKLTSAAVIVLNFLFIVYQSDYRMNNLNGTETPLMAAIGYFFTSYYLVEVLLKLYVEGKHFWSEHEMVWNVFDLTIVFVAVVEVAIKRSGIRMVNTSFLRILRFFKLSRVIRMFSAMRMFKEIRIMLDSLCGCFTLFCFCTLIMSLFLAVFAIFFVQGATELLESGEELDPDYVAGLQDMFGSVSSAMLSLFKVISGGDDWSMFHDAVRELGSFYDLLFIFFVLSYLMAFLNVVTATFCEKAISLAVPTTSELIHNRENKEYNDACELMGLLTKVLNDDGSHVISYDSFEIIMGHPEVEIYFEVRGLKPTSAHRFFKTLCEINGKDEVAFGDFVSACVKLDGFASSIDMHCQSVRELHSYHKLTLMQKDLHEETKEMHAILHNQIVSFGAIIQRLDTTIQTRETTR